jgi:outer membrane protein TolC
LTLAASEADEGAIENFEKVKVIGLYFDALKTRAVADARRNALALAVTLRDAATVRANAGDAPQLDVTRADVAVDRAQADLETADAMNQNAAEALRTETAAAASTLDATAPGSLPPIPPTLLDPQAVVAAAGKLRPEIASARLTAEAAQAAIGTAKAAGFPTLTLSGGYVVGTDSGVPINAPSINANLTVPLGRGAHDKVAIAAAKAVEAKAKTAGIERQILLDVAASSRTLGAAQRASGAMTRARQAAQLELNATEVGYRNGASSSLELTTARATYAQAVVDELSAQYDLEKAQATLDVEVGR